MSALGVFLVVVAAIVAFIVIVSLIRSVRVVPQQRMDVVERLGKYQRTLDPGLHLLVPFIESVRSKVDMREQVVSFPPQPVITSDNLVVSIDTVLYFRVVDPVRATYEIADFLQAIEQLTVTTLRNVIGSMDLERALTSRDEINHHLSSVLDETTGRWGIKVTRVEIKAIEPPPSIRDSMEKQMRAERDRRAAILNAEGVKASQILTAEGDKQAAVLRADGERQASILRAEGQAKALRTVFEAVHDADPDPQVLAYQYLQALPQIAAGPSNKMWIVPAELTRALQGFSQALGGGGGETGDRVSAALGADGAARRPRRADRNGSAAAEAEAARTEAVAAAEKAVADAEAVVEEGPRRLPPAPGMSSGELLGDSVATQAEPAMPPAAGPPAATAQPAAPAGSPAAETPTVTGQPATGEPDEPAAG